MALSVLLIRRARTRSGTVPNISSSSAVQRRLSDSPLEFIFEKFLYIQFGHRVLRKNTEALTQPRKMLLADIVEAGKLGYAHCPNKHSARILHIKMTSPNKTVHRIHFEDFDGRQFERLIFAYHLRAENWSALEWYGQIGSDLGRDIWGVRPHGANLHQTICIQCANRKTLPTTKAIRDIDKVLTCPNGKPKIFRLVCSCPVSASMTRRKMHKPYLKPVNKAWTSAKLSLLGRIPDREVARRIGRTVGTVRQTRFTRGIIYVASNRHSCHRKPKN